MSYHIAASIRINHGFWDDEVPPLRIAPSDPRMFSRLGLLAKPSAARIDVIAETDAFTEPAIITFDVVATSHDVLAVTGSVNWATLPHLMLAADLDAPIVPYADVVMDHAPNRLPGDPLLRMSVAIAATGTREITLLMPTVAPLWAYHFTGEKAKDALQILDPSDTHQFEDLGERALTEGLSARVLRSTAPIALAYRSPARFKLEALQDPPFDPITLIPVLPAAGINMRPADDPAAAQHLQSDIFVSLW